jgi:hypothetical protein
MKIVLVFPPFYLEYMYNLPPLGLIRLATALAGDPHELVLLDFVLAIRKGLRRWEEGSMMMVDLRNDRPRGHIGSTTTFPAAIQLAQKIETKSDAGGSGGHSASFVDRLTLERFPFIDATVREGEETFGIWSGIRRRCHGKRHPGVTFREGERSPNPIGCSSNTLTTFLC